MSDITTTEIVAALRQHGCEPSTNGDGYRSKCPVHDGDNPNVLAISEDGKIYCHKCQANTGDVLKAIGLTRENTTVSRRPKVTVDGKQVTLHDTEQSAIDGCSWSVSQKRGETQRAPDRTHRYHDADGHHIGTVLLWKFSDDKETRQLRKHSDGWICKAMVAPRPLYHLPEILASDNIVICEGEKTADALRDIGIQATTPTQGAKSPAKSDWSVLAGKSVTISVDNDDAGREFGKLVLDLICDIAADVKIVELKDDWSDIPDKGDAADWVEQFADVSSEELQKRFEALPDHREDIDTIVPERQHDAPMGASDWREAIILSLDEKEVNDQVISQLAARGDIFDHSGSLAVITDEVIPGESPRKTIQHLTLAGLREVISQTCWFVELHTGKDGRVTETRKRVSRWCYEAILVRGYWPGIPTLTRIVTSPVLRADGSILQSAGYDAASGLYADLTETRPQIVDSPSSEDVQKSVNLLLDLISDFPFRNDASRTAWLASLLTPLAREAYHGCTGPMFLFDANVRGSGKSLLADINSLIVTGREATRLSSPSNDEECRKRITALVMNNDAIVLIDNITDRFGSAALDAALTGTTWKDRRLGHTELIEAPLRMTWYASGNNVILAADTARRICHIRLESPLENPEDREGFEHPDIRKHVRQNRPALLAAALTILRGYIAAGSPNQKLKPWGSFEGWSDLIRGTIGWCGLADPGETRTKLRSTSDSEAGALRQMLLAVNHVDSESHGLKTSDLLKIATGRAKGYDTDDAESMTDAIENFTDYQISKVSAQRLGSRLSHFRNRVIDEMAFDCSVKQGANYWFVHISGGRGVCGGPVSTESYASDSLGVAVQKPLPDSGENTSTTSTTSTPEISWAAEAFE